MFPNLHIYKNHKNIKRNYEVRSRLLNYINKNNNENNKNKEEYKIDNPTFHILIATIGRNTLENLIDSLSNQLNENDCLTIVFDNNSIRDINNINQLKCKFTIYNEKTKLGYWGHSIRNKYASLLEKRDFIMHADDDDVYYDNCFDQLRQECLNRNIIYIAKMSINKKSIPVDHLPLMIGNIGTPCGIIPYEYNNKSKWGYFYGGDGQFYIDLISRFNHKRINLLIYKCS